jgi:hypothetical protein
MPVMMIAVVQSNFVRQATLTAPHPQHPSDRSIAHRSPLTSPLTNFNPGLGVYNISYFCTRTRSGWEEGRERKGKERKGRWQIYHWQNIPVFFLSTLVVSTFVPAWGALCARGRQLGDSSVQMTIAAAAAAAAICMPFSHFQYPLVLHLISLGLSFSDLIVVACLVCERIIPTAQTATQPSPPKVVPGKAEEICSQGCRRLALFGFLVRKSFPLINRCTHPRWAISDFFDWLTCFGNDGISG